MKSALLLASGIVAIPSDYYKPEAVSVGGIPGTPSPVAGTPSDYEPNPVNYEPAKYGSTDPTGTNPKGDYDAKAPHHEPTKHEPAHYKAPHHEPYPTHPVHPTHVYPDPHAPHPYEPCQDYDGTDYHKCVTVHPIHLPVCDPEHETKYITEYKGEPQCVYVTHTDVSTSTCDTSTVHKVEHTTVYDYCEEVCEYVTYPEHTRTVCGGTHTITPTITEVYYNYEPTYVHPTIISTETTCVTPEPTTKVEYTTVVEKYTHIEYDVDYETVTVKTTPVVTKTEYEGEVVETYYKTQYACPEHEYVTKTIHVPYGCVDHEKTCSAPAVNPISTGPSYGNSTKPEYHGATHPVHTGPSYGGKVDDEVTKPTYGKHKPAGTHPVNHKPTYGDVHDVNTKPSYGAEYPTGTDPVQHKPAYGDVRDVNTKPSYGAEYPTGTDPVQHKPAYGGKVDHEVTKPAYGGAAPEMMPAY